MHSLVTNYLRCSRSMQRQRGRGVAIPRGTPDATVGHNANRAKTFVLACIGRLVADGHVQWDSLDSGDILLAFNTGERFLLAKTVIICLA